MSVDTTLQKLINISSVTGDEILILDFIEEFLSKNNFSGELIRNDGGIIAIPKNSSQKIALVGHVDTVPLSKTQKLKFDDIDLISGRGSVDMKGGISIILHSLVEVNQDIIGVFYTAEEGPYEMNGLGELMPTILSNKNLEFSIILEPTNCEIELGCLGTLNANIKLKGIAAHSARPWVGENPIYKIGDISKKVSDNEITLLDIEGLEFKQVLSITKVSSGIANNVIPDEAILNVNFRFSPEMTNDDAQNFINNMFSEFGEIEITSSSEGAMPNIENSNIKNFISSTGLSPNPKQAWTDIARFYSHGIASVNFGPGDPLLAHTADEHVSKKQLLESYELLMNFLRRL